MLSLYSSAVDQTHRDLRNNIIFFFITFPLTLSLEKKVASTSSSFYSSPDNPHLMHHASWVCQGPEGTNCINGPKQPHLVSPTSTSPPRALRCYLSSSGGRWFEIFVGF